MKKVRALAKVQITVEVEASGAWGPDCSIGQLYNQAEESAKGSLANLFSAQGKSFRIVGSPKVLGIMTEDL